MYIFGDTAAILNSTVSNCYYGMFRKSILINSPSEHPRIAIYFETIEFKMAAQCCFNIPDYVINISAALYSGARGVHLPQNVTRLHKHPTSRATICKSVYSLRIPMLLVSNLWVCTDHSLACSQVIKALLLQSDFIMIVTSKT